MGIPEFLSRVLESAGRPIDLRDYAEQGIVRAGNKRRRRPLRIGIDVSSWVYKAAHGFGDMLGDERHLTNYGRATLHHEQQVQQQQEQLDEPSAPLTTTVSNETIHEYVQVCVKFVLGRLETLRDTSHADLLVVLDGATPPLKAQEVQRRRHLRHHHETQRDKPVDPHEEEQDDANAQRTKAFKRAGAGRHFPKILTALMQGLRQAHISFLVAPYEADSQLAYLSHHAYLDLIVTEDSDLVAHGAKDMLYKSVAEIGKGVPKGILLEFVAIGSSSSSSSSSKKGQGGLHLMDFSPVMMTVLFVAVGCDYNDKLKGIGLVTASRIVRTAFLERDPPNTPTHTNRGGGAALAHVLEQLYQQSYTNTTDFTKDFRRAYEDRFLAALFMYRHPIVYDPMERRNVLSTRSDDGDENEQNENGTVVVVGDAELVEYEPYARLCKDPERMHRIVGDIPEASATAAAEGRARMRRTTHEAAHEEEAATAAAAQGERSDDDGDERVFESQEQHLPMTMTTTTTPPEEEEGMLLATQEEVGRTTPAAADGTTKTTTPRQNGGRTQDDDDDSPNDNLSPSPKGSDHDNTSLERRSPNLLYSTTPEKTQASQTTAATNTSASASAASKRSPNLLYSSTPEEKTQTEEDAPATQPQASQPESSSPEEEYYDV
jgi:5'-3' exonuclease